MHRWLEVELQFNFENLKISPTNTVLFEYDKHKLFLVWYVPSETVDFYRFKFQNVISFSNLIRA